MNNQINHNNAATPIIEYTMFDTMVAEPNIHATKSKPNGDNGQPPEKPSGDNGQPPEPPEGGNAKQQ